MQVETAIFDSSQNGKLMRAAQIEERIRELEPVLRSWQPRGDETVYTAWTWFKASGYKTLPYAGGLLDQPLWVMQEFAAYGLIEEYHELLESQKQLLAELVRGASNE